MTPETATLVAAVIAASAAVAAAVLAALSARRTRKQTERLQRAADARHRELAGREQWWIRFSWALEKAISGDPREVSVGLALVWALLDAPWATEDDSELALTIADTVVAMAEGGASVD